MIHAVFTSVKGFVCLSVFSVCFHSKSCQRISTKFFKNFIDDLDHNLDIENETFRGIFTVAIHVQC